MIDTIIMDENQLLEIQERQEAEIEFLAAAYTAEEAWITTSTRSCIESDRNLIGRAWKQFSIHRRLKLPIDPREHEKIMSLEEVCDHGVIGKEESSFITIELILTMPCRYPVDPTCALDIQAKIDEISPNIPARKLAVDAIPNLIQVCTEIARDEFIEEAVLVILSRAEEWVDSEWNDIIHEDKINHQDSKEEMKTNENKHETATSSSSYILGRKLIFSHHIIAKSKRKAIKTLSREYNLGGYFKIGWPGIIIIEGNQMDCDKFVDEIKSMRWQHLVVRGEEQVPVDSITILNELRKFTLQLDELGEDQMSDLASICRDVGLEDLFMTSMKVYKTKDATDYDTLSSSDMSFNQIDQSQHKTNDEIYGVLIHIDHMNDERGYHKWIQKSCKATGCSYLFKKCFNINDNGNKNTAQKRRPIIIVGLWGDILTVKKVLKRWRISRVDVDSRGQPCLERMMTILKEGYILSFDENSTKRFLYDVHSIETSIGDLKGMLKYIGGDSWENELGHLVTPRP